MQITLTVSRIAISILTLIDAFFIIYGGYWFFTTKMFERTVFQDVGSIIFVANGIVFLAGVITYIIFLLTGEYDGNWEKTIEIKLPGHKTSKDQLLIEYGQACLKGDKYNEDRLHQILLEKGLI